MEQICDDIPRVVADALRYDALDADAIDAWGRASEDADALRGQLEERGLVAFIGEGAVLPRRSGVDDRPLAEGAVPFVPPPELALELEERGYDWIKEEVAAGAPA